MTNTTIGWCDKCKKEVGKDHDCTKIHNIWKLKKVIENEE